MIDINKIVDIACQAGEQVMDVYLNGFAIYCKNDQSPLTEADLRSHNYIVSALRALTPDIPVLSEESSADVMSERATWQCYWLIDPLDGTKEFIKKNGEFTVNIALIQNGEPVVGVVHAPALSVTYWGSKNKGAFKKTKSGICPIHVSALPDSDQTWRVVGSRSHSTPEFDQFMARLPEADIVSMGSSLKLCLVAEGKADIYPRLGLTSEWDTAAAHAVVTASGGQVLAWPSLLPLRYNQNADSLLNPFFIVCALPDTRWASDETMDAVGIVYERRDHCSKAEIVWHNTQVTPEMRASALAQKPCCIWLTGLSGSGKSTIANALELKLHQMGRHTFLLDGDNIRHGLNKDLGMSEKDRAENIRRVGEVAKLMLDAGLTVVTAFISPFRQDRDRVRSMFQSGDFIEVFVDTPLQECERRDAKGLYQKARAGEIKDFTGIDSPYEQPLNPEVIIKTHIKSIEECISEIQKHIPI